jgi:ferrous iron transport protein B
MGDVKNIGIVGNPNVGKTYLFNQLTACSGCVGNWAGVTSETCQAKSCAGESHMILDLPGCYGIDESGGANDESAHEINRLIHEKKVDLWLNIIDAQYIERQMYLTLQLLEAGQNVIVVLNRIDLLSVQKIAVDVAKLAQELQIPVVKVSAKLGTGIRSLQATIEEMLCTESKKYGPVVYMAALERYLVPVEQKLSSRYMAWQQLLQTEQSLHAPAWTLDPEVAQLREVYGSVADCMALTRRQWIGQVCQQAVSRLGQERMDQDKAWDKWFLHRWLGLPIFFMMMFTVFWLSMGFGQLLQGILEPLLQLVLVQFPSTWIRHYELAYIFEVLLVQGVGLSLVTALSFFPILLVMFFAMHLLEESGYMTRAAIVMDRLMKWLYLPGEAMVALVLGLGCNVPGILATRHIPKKSDKIITALMMPFMSCGARLTIFAVFSAVFFPNHAAQTLFFLYVLGIFMALITGLTFRYFGVVEKREQEHYLLEIPGFQYPSLRLAWRHALQRSQRFVSRALVMILPVCIVLAMLNHVSITGEVGLAGRSDSLLAVLGRCLSVVFYPMGLDGQHWPLVVALVTGLLAKEVVITTLSLLYTQMSVAAASPVWSTMALWEACWVRIFENLSQLPAYFIPTMVAEVPDWAPHLQDAEIAPVTVMAYLIFTLLYFPCVGTLYATARQVGWRWAGVSLLWSTVSAYGCAIAYVLLAPWIGVAHVMIAVMGSMAVGIYQQRRWFGAQYARWKERRQIALDTL